MTTLDSNQRKILKALIENPLTSTKDMSEQDMYVYGYLREAGYVRIETEDFVEELSAGRYVTRTAISSIQITEKGKAYLYDHRTTMLCFAVPTIISIISLLISLTSLFIGQVMPLLIQSTK